MTDFHNPIIVRKHLDSRKQAIEFRDKYYDKRFEVIDWKTAFKYGLKINNNKRHRWGTTKYNFPSDRKTPRQRQIYRDMQRRKLKKDIRRPKVTETAVWEILNDKPMFFIKRLKKYRDWHLAYSSPVWGFKRFIKEYKWPVYVNHLSNIVRCLEEYYDLGLYDKEEVTLLIYKKWKKYILKHLENIHAIPQKLTLVQIELEARGFIEESESGMTENDNYLKSIHIQPTLVYPEKYWHSVQDQGMYEMYVYDVVGLIGIPGYTEVHVAGLNKRK